MDYFFDSVSKRRLFFSNVVLFIEQVTQYVVYDEIWQLISLCKLSWIWHSIFEYMYVVELVCSMENAVRNKYFLVIIPCLVYSFEITEDGT